MNVLYRRILVTLGMVGSLILPGGPAHAAEPSPQDVTFVRAAHQANLAEIAAGQVAWKKTTDPQVKNLAATFMRNHIHMDADLYKTARSLRIFLPDKPTEEQQALTKRYEAAPAATFDEYYISTQLAAHRETRQLIETQVKKGSQPEVKRLAEQVAPIIAGHQELLRKAAAAEGMAGYAGSTGRSNP
jgi:putative membrane protein